MMAAKQLNPIKITIGMHVNIKINLILFSCQERFLNLRANMGISATNRKQDSNMNMKRKNALNFSEIRNPWLPTIREAQNKVLAGVGTPMNDDV